MKAKRTTGTGINGVDVHFTIADLVNLNQLVHEIMTNRPEKADEYEQSPAEALALVVYKITNGGLELEQSSKDMHGKDFDIFDNKKKEVESTYTKEDIFTEVECAKNIQKNMVGVLINLESRAPLLQVVKDEVDDIPDKIPDIKVIGKIDLDKI